jgi:hypothetical protein
MRRAVVLLSAAAGLGERVQEPHQAAPALAELLGAGAGLPLPQHHNSSLQAGALRELAKAFQVGSGRRCPCRGAGQLPLSVGCGAAARPSS